MTQDLFTVFCNFCANRPATGWVIGIEDGEKSSRSICDECKDELKGDHDEP